MTEHNVRIFGNSNDTTKLTDRLIDDKEKRCFLTDELRVRETHVNEQSVGSVSSVSSSNFDNISSRMHSGNLSSELSPTPETEATLLFL